MKPPSSPINAGARYVGGMTSGKNMGQSYSTLAQARAASKLPRQKIATPNANRFRASAPPRQAATYNAVTPRTRTRSSALPQPAVPVQNKFLQGGRQTRKRSSSFYSYFNISHFCMNDY